MAKDSKYFAQKPSKLVPNDVQQKPHPIIHQKPQRLSYFNNALIIAMVDFPIYFLTRITSRHFFVAGGGGSSRTGVLNQINLFELIPTEESCTAKLQLKYKTPSEVEDAIMNAALIEEAPTVNNRLIAAGNPPYIYSIPLNLYDHNFSVTEYEKFRPDRFKTPIKSVKCTIGKLFTGGTDGKLTVWSTFDLTREPFGQTKAHSKEIDEIDVEPNLGRLVTLCRSEVCCSIWDIETLNLIYKFDKTHINESNPDVSNSFKYNYRSCRFSYSKQSSKSHKTTPSFFLTVCNPSSTKFNSRLFKWDSSTLKKLGSADLSEKSIMAFNVSPDGLYAGLGTVSGSVLVYDIDSLSKSYRINSAHSNIVTQLEFLSSDPDALLLTNSNKFALLSVSIDRRVILHRPKRALEKYGIPLFAFIVANCLFSFVKFLYHE